MECILGETLLFEEINGNFVLTINGSTELFLSSYEMAKFMYLLRSYLYQKDIDPRVIKFVALDATYQSEETGELFKANIWPVRNEDSITVNVHYTMLNGVYKSAKLNDEFTSPEVTAEISLESAQDIVHSYIEYEYAMLSNADD